MIPLNNDFLNDSNKSNEQSTLLNNSNISNIPQSPIYPQPNIYNNNINNNYLYLQ